MDFFENHVPSEATLSAMDQNDNEQEKEYNEYAHQSENLAQSDACSKKKSQFVTVIGDSGDQHECVAMDLITRQPEHPDHRLENHHHRHTTAASPSLNTMISGRQAVDPVPGHSSSPSSHYADRQADVTLIKKTMCHRLLRVPTDGDKRLASSHVSFLLGRVLSLSGSIGLLIGLFFRFIFMGKDGPAKSVPFTIIGMSIVMIVVGASLVIWSAHKSQKARKQFDQDLIQHIPHD